MAKTEVEQDRELFSVYKWRLNWLRRGGFTKRNADLLASTDIDYRYAIRLRANCVEKGFSEDFVMGLLL